jgi:hypothetical protein
VHFVENAASKHDKIRGISGDQVRGKFASAMGDLKEVAPDVGVSLAQGLAKVTASKLIELRVRQNAENIPGEGHRVAAGEV